MKKLILFIAMYVTFAFNLSAIKNCECGSHSTAITAYSVSGDGCCSSSTVGMGQIHYYEQNEAGTWQLIRSELVAGPVAQSRCCPI